jgi:hypothetical protein
MCLIEAESKQLIDHETAKQRLKIGQYGLIVASVIKDYRQQKYIASASINVIGLSDQVSQDEIKEQSYRNLSQLLESVSFERDFSEFEESARIAVRKPFKNRFGVKPVTIIQLHEIRND